MKNRVPMITTCLIGAGLLAVATFMSVEQKTLAAQPPADPAYTAHSAHVAAGTSQAGGQQPVEAQMAELRARIQQLETRTQQQPAQSPPSGAMPMGAENPSRMRPMPGMESGAKPMQGMAGMNATGGKGGMGGGPALADQMAELRGKMQRLEMTMQQQSGSSSGAMPMGGQPGMSSGTKQAQGGMAGMNGLGAAGATKPASGMSGMAGAGGGASGPSGEMGMMGMMDKMMGMMGGMGGKGGSSMATPSALPGFPGASHLYHLGATGFFLDHPQHIALSTEQQMRLNQIKEQAALDKTSADRSVQECEQDLWTLTAAEQPDNAQIEAKVAEIEKLKGDARLRFIGAVGDAAKILNDGQLRSLSGFAPPAPAAPAAAPMVGMKGM